ncbi:MAG TPA: ABC transporter permease [Acidobacteriaceae bacterium]|nr:ABC transporter permease [Acidobacteriaceae bacterium]
MRFPWSTARRKQDLQEEIDGHVRMAISDRIARGEPEDAARQSAMREFGNAPLIEEVTRETWGWMWLERLGWDFRYAFRQMRRSPGFAVTVIGTLALGIGAATAMFTVVDHVLLRPLPYRDADRLIDITANGGDGAATFPAPWADIAQWIAQSHSFEQIAFWTGMGGRNFLDQNTTAVPVDAEKVSSNLFQTLGVKPLLGRGFVPESPGFGAAKNIGTIVLSDRIWKADFGGDPGVLGRTVKINDISYTVVGVMPTGFTFPFGNANSSQVWLPIQLGDKDRARDDDQYNVIGRVRKGVSIQAASAEMAVIQKRIAPEYTNPDQRIQHSRLRLQRYGDSLIDGDLSKALLALLAAAGVLWLISGVNAMNLMLARATARQRELAVRGALGASRWRMVQQMMIEGLVLSTAAALAGIGLAIASVRLAEKVRPIHLNVDLSTHLNIAILAMLCLLTLLSGLLSSLWPAWMAARSPMEPALKQGGPRSGTGRAQHRTRAALIAVEVALSLTLLVSCGLLLRTIYALRHVPLGYRTDHILVAEVTTIPVYRFGSRNMTVDLYQPLLKRVQHLPGVQTAGFMTEVPLGQTFRVTLGLETNGKPLYAYLKAVSPEVQKIFGMKMAGGRFFSSQDTATSEPVVVVNRAFAKIYSPNRHDPSAILGGELLNLRKNARTRIIGVLDDERQGRIGEPSQPEVDVAIAQITPDSSLYRALDGMAMDLAVRTDQPSAEMIPQLRAILKQASPELENTTNFSTMDQIVEDSYGSQRLAAHLLEIFGGTALLLSVAGLYGLLAYLVTQRTQEMGVRIALGASRGHLLWLVLRQAGGMLLAGVIVGGALAFASSRMIQSYLYGVGAHDSWTLFGAAALLFAFGMLAAYLPARRAAGVDPMEALRAE